MLSALMCGPWGREDCVTTVCERDYVEIKLTRMHGDNIILLRKNKYFTSQNLVPL